MAGTAADDLAGTARMAWRFLTGRGQVDLAGSERLEPHDDLGRRLVSFGVVGAVSTAVSLALFLLLRPAIGPLVANVVALAATFAANAWANARFTARRRRVNWPRAVATFLVSVALSTAALLMVRALGAGPAVEVVVLLASWLAASMARLALVDGWTGRDGRP